MIIVAILVMMGMTNKDLYGQKKIKANKHKELQLADFAFENGNYYTAIEFYKRLYDRDHENAYITYQLGESYYSVRDYENAKEWYHKSVKQNKDVKTLALYKYALMLKMCQEYEEASEAFLDFRKKYKGKDAGLYRRIAKKEVGDCKYAMENLDETVNVEVTFLGDAINAPNSDFAPLPYGDDKLIFASLDSDSLVVIDKKNKKEPKIKLYYSERNFDQWSQSKEFTEGPFNDKDFHTANGAFSDDKKTFFFTKCKENINKKMICGIYVSKKRNGKWQKPSKLSESINNPEFTSTHPSVGRHYKKGMQILYFASDRPGGRGGFDIWYADIRNDSQYGAAKNIGRRINTFGDELTPFYDNINGKLYFSSNGQTNFGGLDIFVSEGAGNNWLPPDNMGIPLNSHVDDFYYILSDTYGEGFFVSNRPGGIKIKGGTCCDDIYQALWNNILRIAVNGWVYDEDDPTKTPLKDVEVFLFVTGFMDVSLENKMNVFKGKEVTTKDENGVVQSKKYFFNLGLDNFDLGPDYNYKLIALKDGYLNGFARVSTIGIRESDTLNVDLFLKKINDNKTFTLKNIYYDFDKAILRQESMNELENLLGLLYANPEIIVEIGSHTDSKGNDDYNIKLSQKRAESVVRFLIQKGVPSNRLSAKGYGETLPIAPNTNPDGSDNPDGRQLNRRTEFKIVGEIEGLDYRNN